MRKRLVVILAVFASALGLAAVNASPAAAGQQWAYTQAYGAAVNDCYRAFPNTCYGTKQYGVVLAPNGPGGYYTFYFRYYGYYGSRGIHCNLIVNSWSSGAGAWIEGRGCFYN